MDDKCLPLAGFLCGGMSLRTRNTVSGALSAPMSPRQNFVSGQRRLWFEETRFDCVIIEEEVRAPHAGGTCRGREMLGQSVYFAKMQTVLRRSRAYIRFEMMTGGGIPNWLFSSIPQLATSSCAAVSEPTLSLCPNPRHRAFPPLRSE